MREDNKRRSSESLAVWSSSLSFVSAASSLKPPGDLLLLLLLLRLLSRASEDDPLRSDFATRRALAPWRVESEAEEAEEEEAIE